MPLPLLNPSLTQHPLPLLTLVLFCGATEGTPEEWRKVLDLNVVALCLCTREAVASMRERGVDDGHIIHINRWVCGAPFHQVGSVKAGVWHYTYQSRRVARVYEFQSSTETHF